MDLNGIQSRMVEQVARYSTDTNRSGTFSNNDSGLPISWGPDTVSISEEARAAAQAAQQPAAGEDGSEETSGAAQEFATYMAKKRSKAQSADPESQIKDLEDKLKSLESELSSVASEGKTDEATNVRIEQLSTQIESIKTQIAELAALLSKTKNGQA